MAAMTYEAASVFAQTVVLVLFVALFIVVLAYVFWPGNKKGFDEAAQLPLEDDDKPEGDAR
jgi:cytochrome c oxidase cbb3-type subunit IV